MFTIDIALHHKKRRVLNQVFTESSVRAAGEYIVQHVDRWNEILIDGAGDQWSQSRNLTFWNDALSYDILGELCFGKSLNIKEPGENPLKALPHLIIQNFCFTYAVRLGLITYSPLALIETSDNPTTTPGSLNMAKAQRTQSPSQEVRTA